MKRFAIILIAACFFLPSLASAETRVMNSNYKLTHRQGSLWLEKGDVVDITNNYLVKIRGTTYYTIPGFEQVKTIRIISNERNTSKPNTINQKKEAAKAWRSAKSWKRKAGKWESTAVSRQTTIDSLKQSLTKSEDVIGEQTAKLDTSKGKIESLEYQALANEIELRTRGEKIEAGGVAIGVLEAELSKTVDNFILLMSCWAVFTVIAFLVYSALMQRRREPVIAKVGKIESILSDKDIEDLLGD